ncbi:11474_t:CDS:2, partial [Funneliformis geosporum]
KSEPEISVIIRNYLSTPYNLYNIQIIRPRLYVTREDPTSLLPNTPIRLVVPQNANSVGVSAVGQTFCILQLIHKSACIADYDFSTGYPQYDDVLKADGEIRPIWILLVDGRSEENPRHLKNIKLYIQLFEATLSEKLAGITLPIDHFGIHLNSQEKVFNPKLTIQNFQYARKALCDIWC